MSVFWGFKMKNLSEYESDRLKCLQKMCGSKTNNQLKYLLLNGDYYRSKVKNTE